MLGDKNKPQSSFGRWIDHFWDGAFKTTKKNKRKIPSQHIDKNYEKKWKRRRYKEELKNDILGE